MRGMLKHELIFFAALIYRTVMSKTTTTGLAQIVCRYNPKAHF